MQRAAAENVDVQVGNALAPVRTVIDDDAEALGQLETGGELTRCEEQVTEQGLVAGLSQTEPIDAALRNHEHMHRRLRIDVMNGDALVVLVLDAGGDFPGDDAFEEGRGGHDGASRAEAFLQEKQVE